MLRTTFAAMALVAVMAATSLAGDCLSCGYRGHAGGPPYAGASGLWDGYCDTGCDPCGGCNRCCFPLLHGALHRMGRALDCLMPDPCCRPKCGYPAPTVGCCQPACGIEGGMGIPAGMPAVDPFMDDMPATPMPTKDARVRSFMGSPKMTYRAAPTPTPARHSSSVGTSVMKTPSRKAAAPKVSAKPSGKTAATSKAMGKTVLKVAYEQEDRAESYSVEDADAPPVAPASIRNAAREAAPARVVAKPIVKAPEADMPVNPLR